MELDASHRKGLVNQAFDRPVMQVAMTDQEAAVARQCLAINLEFVILRRHGDPPGP